MKKALLIVTAILFLGASFLGLYQSLNVIAAGHRLYIFSQDDKLYYDSNYDSQLFANHHGMKPGEIYTDELEIQNESNLDFDIYLKVSDESSDTNSEADSDTNSSTNSEANSNTNLEAEQGFLDNIKMTLSMDGEIFYVGTARGMSYDDVSLRDAVRLTEFKSGEAKILTAQWELQESEYSVYDDDALTRWTFYSALPIPEGDDPVEPEPTPEPEPEPSEPTLAKPTPGKPSRPSKPAQEILPNPNTLDKMTWHWPALMFGASGCCGVILIVQDRKERANATCSGGKRSDGYVKKGRKK